MKNKLRFILILVFITLVTSLMPNVAFAQQGTPDITAANGVLIDYETGEVLFNKNAHEKTYPASTTKVMTAILALENAKLDETITIDYDLFVGGSSLYILKGESFTVEELIKALLIRSANDAAEVLAIHISGSVEEFAKLMNERAKELGALNTNFTNPHGLPDKDHVTTAYDLAMIAKHAMSYDIFREIVKTPTLQFEPTEQTPETRYFRNSNRFLWGTGGSNKILYGGEYVNIKYDVIDGVKTGYTDAAGNCLISSGFKNDHRLISVILGAQGNNVYIDSRTLIDFGHENFKLISFKNDSSDTIEVEVKDGRQGNVNISAADTTKTIVPMDTELSNIEKIVSINKDIKAPIDKGDVLGKVSYSLNGKVIGEANLIAEEAVEEQYLIIKLVKSFKFLFILFGLFILWRSVVFYYKLQRHKRRSFSYKSKRRSSYGYSKNLFK